MTQTIRTYKIVWRLYKYIFVLYWKVLAWRSPKSHLISESGDVSKWRHENSKQCPFSGSFVFGPSSQLQNGTIKLISDSYFIYFNENCLLIQPPLDFSSTSCRQNVLSNSLLNKLLWSIFWCRVDFGEFWCALEKALGQKTCIFIAPKKP